MRAGRPFENQFSLAGALIVSVIAASIASMLHAAPGQVPAFVSVEQTLPSGGIKLSGGKSMDPNDWESIAISTTDRLTCTAVLVGQQVLITSAHCVDADSDALKAVVMLGTVKFKGQPIPLTECEMHPVYAAAAPNGKFPRSGRDVALCKLKFPANGVVPESVGHDGLVQGGHVVLMGYGCFDLKIVNGKLTSQTDPPNAPVLRLGDQKIAATALALKSSDSTFVRTVSQGPEPNVCPGDSGGPVLTGISTASPLKGRRVSGLNAAYNDDWSVTSEYSPVFFSYLAPFGTMILDWAKGWADKRGLVICGIQRDPGIDGCRL